MRPGPLGGLFGLALAGLSSLTAQAPQEAWRTITTRHYRIHYPPALADWGREVAARIEGIHGQVVDLVGYASPEPVQVLLMDPMEEPNGMAMPLLPCPYVVLWRTEPRSDDLHGATLSDWTEELVSHELTHIHHLMRPRRPRTTLDNLFGLPLGPLVLKCSRWVMEGYATLAEGRITGSGRPHSALRAALLRQWARTGKLPPYGALDNPGGFLGGNVAYLVGSAYLEWLETQRPGTPDVLQRFWKQLASRKNRSFEASFLATFGFSAQDGYQRFQAETTHDALEWEARLKTQGLREGELVLRAEGALRDLAVSPDGTRLLASLEAPGHSGLRLWNLQAKAVPRPPGRPDPLNGVEDAPPETPVRRAAAELPALNHRAPQRGEWVDDQTIRFQLKHAAQDGSLHRRAALWHLRGGLDLTPATVPPARWKTLDPVHREGSWRLDLEGQTVPLPGQAVGRAWVDEARSLLWAACEVEGVCNLVKVPFSRQDGRLRFQGAEVLTRTASAAWNPAPTPDGKALFFTTLDARGMEVRKLDLALPPLAEAPAPEARVLTRNLIMPPPVTKVDLPRADPPPPSTPYRATDNPWLQLAEGLSLTPSGESYQVGLAGADLLGRCSWQVLAGFGNGAGPRGAMAGLSSAAWPWKPSVTLFSALERPSLQRFAPVAEDRQRQGGEMAFTWNDQGDTPTWFSPVAAAERVEDLTAGGGTATRSLLGLRTGLTALWARGPWGLAATPVLQAYEGQTAGDATNRWHTLRAALVLKVETPVLPLRLGVEAGRIGNADAARPERFHLGGTPTSLVPESLDANRVEQPALPAFLATGDRFFRWRADAGGAFSAYLEGTALGQAGQERPPFLKVAGLQGSLDSPLGTVSDPALRHVRLQFGLHRPLDGIMKGRTVATFTLVLRP